MKLREEAVKFLECAVRCYIQKIQLSAPVNHEKRMITEECTEEVWTDTQVNSETNTLKTAFMSMIMAAADPETKLACSKKPDP